jgi:hypothetical protein
LAESAPGGGNRRKQLHLNLRGLIQFLRPESAGRFGRWSWLLGRIALGRIARDPAATLLLGSRRLPTSARETGQPWHAGHGASRQRAHHIACVEKPVDQGVDFRHLNT